VNGSLVNMAASVRQRLKNKGRDLALPFQEIVQRYAIERFLMRLSKSEYHERFVLKGAQMLIAWRGANIRPTMDIDLLGYTDNSPENMTVIAKKLCRMNKPEEDGLLFSEDSVATARIKEDADYSGVRVTFEGKLDTIKIVMQIDVGFNEAVTPQPDKILYPSLLGMPEPELRGYNRETTLAEKYEAMVKLGELNSRMKDFFDVWLLSQSFSFRSMLLANAIKQTFLRRGTALNDFPVFLDHEFRGFDIKQKQWAAFIRKSRLTNVPPDFRDVTSIVSAFIIPVVKNLIDKRECDLCWDAPGPWRTR